MGMATPDQGRADDRAQPASDPRAGVVGGFTFVLQDRAGGEAQRFAGSWTISSPRRASDRAGLCIHCLYARVPQIEYEVDRDKVKSLGCRFRTVFFALQTFLAASTSRFQPVRPDLPRDRAAEAVQRAHPRT